MNVTHGPCQTVHRGAVVSSRHFRFRVLSRVRPAWPVLCVLGILLGFASSGQAQPIAGERGPLLRLQTQAPISQVTALSFSPDGAHLYATGWDKIVHVWSWNKAAGRLRPNAAGAFRVNIGPGTSGFLNTLAVSADGRYLAVAGQQVTAAIAGFRSTGFVWPHSSLTADDLREQGQIYIYNTINRDLQILRGHLGQVVGLAFSPVKGSSRLVSLATEVGPSGALGRVRVWDITTGREAAQPAWDLPVLGTEAWPTLTVQQQGPDLQSLFVAVAWGDNRLRVWNAGTNEIAERPLVDCVTCAFLPEGLELLAGEWPPIKAQDWGLLGRWSVARSPQGPLQLAASTRQPNKISLRLKQVPVAIGYFSSRPDVPVDHAAVAVFHEDATQAAKRYELVVVNLGTGAVVTRSIPLGQDKRPCLAVASRTRQLAVYPDVNGRIAVHHLDDLLRQVERPIDTLKSEGIPVGSVAFAQNPKGERGLLLGEEVAGGPPGAGPQPVLNLTLGQMTLDRAGWQGEQPQAPAGWKAQSQGIDTIQVTAPNMAPRLIRLEKLHRITAFALSPPVAPAGIPLLAVAADVRGEQVLSLYHAGTGDRLRRCIAHTEPVTSLSFSADGKLLASAARDRTVCVWWLPDIAQNYGKSGLIRGLGVRASQPGQLVIDRILETAQPTLRDRLRSSDILLGVGEAGQVKSFQTAAQFYHFVSTRKPGSPLTLETTREGVRQSVAVVVEQAVDERKPLFTLFQAARGKSEVPSWIAWNPQGPFTSSDALVESSVGWHFNTDRADAAPEFAELGKYRATYFGQGLLKALIETGAVPAQWPPRRAAPNVSLGVFPEKGDLFRRDDEEHVLVRNWKIKGILDIQGLASGEVREIGWTLERLGAADEVARPLGTMTFVPRTGMWEADLSKVDVPRGLYRLSTHIAATDTELRIAPQTQLIRFQPPAPRITIDEFPQGQVEEASVRFKAHIDASGPVKIALRQNGKLLTDVKLLDKNRIDTELSLTPGRNDLELVAINEGALPGYEIFETSHAPSDLRVVLMIPDKPTITLTSLTADGRRLDPGSLIEVQTPQVQIRGTAAAPPGSKLKVCKILVQPRVPQRPDAAVKELTFASAVGSGTFEMAQDITLQPGEQSVRLIAGTAGGNEEVPALRIVYRPPLPDVTVEQPAETTLIYAGEASRTIRLQARVLNAADKFPWMATILANDQPVLIEGQPLVADYDASTQTLSASVPLQAGAQSLRWRLSNAWQKSTSAEEVHVDYHRLPRVLQVTGPTTTEQTHVTLTAVIDAPSEFKLQQVHVLVNGTSLPDESISFEPSESKVPQQLGLWTATLRDLPLSVAPNHIDISAENEQGTGESVRHSIRLMIPPPVPPRVAFTNPPHDDVTTPSIKLNFDVYSTDPLKRVELLVNGAPSNSLDQAPQAGRYSQTILLKTGLNRLEAVATTVRGGQSKSYITVNFVPLPIQIKVDSVAWGTASVAADPNSSSQILFPEAAAEGIVKIRGRLIWGENAVFPPGLQYLKTWVNGFLQSSTPLDVAAKEGQPGSLAFEIAAVLNRESNVIEMELPTLPTSAASPLRFELQSSQPKTDQKLHLLLIGMDFETDEALIKNFREVFAVEGDQAFPPHVAVQKCLTRDRVDGNRIRFQLLAYKQLIGNSGEEALNHILLVYYQGREIAHQNGFVLADWEHEQANLAPREAGSAIDNVFLTEYFRNTKGAHLIFLDVLSDDPSRSCRLETHLGVLRSSWRAANAMHDVLLPGILSQALPKNNRFRDVANEVSLFLQNRTGGSRVRLDSHVPNDLADLALGQP